MWVCLGCKHKHICHFPALPASWLVTYNTSGDRGETAEHVQNLFLPDSEEEAFGFGLLVFISGMAACKGRLKDDN